MNKFASGAPPALYRGARACTLLFVAAVLASYGYVMITGTYNGDFFGVPETLGFFGQGAMLVAAMAPYGIGWLVYRHYKAKPYRGAIEVPQRRLTVVFFLMVVWFIVLALKWDVGVLGREIYDAPALIKPFIQITNRINPFYLGVLFILMYRGPRKVLWLGIALLIALGIARAGLGVFIYLLLAGVIRGQTSITRFVRRHKLALIFGLLVFPTAVSQLYQLRSSLRDKEPEADLTITQVITARLVGRLSSFSNSALVVQETAHFKDSVRHLDPLYYERQAFGGIFGAAFVPEITPERMLINVYGGDWVDISFMVGTPGNLYIAWLISPAIAALNLSLLIGMCMATFSLSRVLRVPVANEFALMLLLYPLTSGVSNEFSSLVAAIASFVVLFAILAIPRRPMGSGFSQRADVRTD
jgi:hypothetical protein